MTRKATVPKRTALRVVCVGDSIVGPSDLEKYLKFSWILELMLKARCPGRRVEVINRGIGGNTTTQILERFDRDVIRAKPAIVIMDGGANDAGAKAGMPAAATRRNLEEILLRLRQADIKVLMMNYHLIPDPAHPDRAWSWAVKNNALIARVAKRNQVPLCDCATAMSKALASKRFGPWELVHPEDGLHTRPAGELVLAEAIFRCLDKQAWLAEPHISIADG